MSIILKSISTISDRRPLSDLAGIIKTLATAIENALKSSGAPQPSLAVGTSSALPLGANLEESRDELVEALDELRALVCFLW